MQLLLYLLSAPPPLQDEALLLPGGTVVTFVTSNDFLGGSDPRPANMRALCQHAVHGGVVPSSWLGDMGLLHVVLL